MLKKILSILFILTFRLNAGIGAGYSTAGALPVELTSFTAQIISSRIILNWSTATEVNNYGFDVERKGAFAPLSKSENSIYNWEKIGFVLGHGNSNTPNNYSFIDNNLLGGKVFYYRLKQIDVDGKFKYSDILTITLNVPGKVELMQNSPNPFNPSTSIKFFIPNTADVTIKIYDILGKEVKTLIKQQTQAGYHIVLWNGRDNYGNNASSGIYLYMLTAGRFTAIKKMLLLK